MALTKTSATLSSAITTTQTTTGVSVTTDYAPVVCWKLIQVGTATTPATFKIQVSPDGTNWYDWTGAIAPGVAAATYTGAIELPMGVSQARIDFTAQSGGTSSTFSAQLGQVTAI